MGVIVDLYKKNFLRRFDREEGIPYYSAADFPGLASDQGFFENSDGVSVSYRYYYYEGYRRDMTVLFCHGLGPGHAAYLAEIETLCRAGLRVLTFDCTGCGESGGERLPSANAQTKDAVELLGLLDPAEEIVPVGHSMGGYTALSLANILPSVKRAVVISAFLTVSDMMMGFVKVRFLANRIKRYEKKLDPRFGSNNNRAYIASTDDSILWIHSTDDPVVSFRYNAGVALKTAGPNVRVVTVEGKKHNPQYTREALDRMNEWIGGFNRLIGEGKLDTSEAKAAYFADKPIEMMTAQDPEIYRLILDFLLAPGGDEVSARI